MTNYRVEYRYRGGLWQRGDPSTDKEAVLETARRLYHEQGYPAVRVLETAVIAEWDEEHNKND